MDDYLARIRELLSAEFEVNADHVVPQARLYEDLDIDSIDAVDLVVRLNEMTGKKVPPDKFKAVKTVGDVIKVLEAL